MMIEEDYMYFHFQTFGNMPLFSKPKSPAEMVKTLRDSLTTLEQSSEKKKLEKVPTMLPFV